MLIIIIRSLAVNVIRSQAKKRQAESKSRVDLLGFRAVECRSFHNNTRLVASVTPGKKNLASHCSQGTWWLTFHCSPAARLRSAPHAWKRWFCCSTSAGLLFARQNACRHRATWVL